MTNPQKRQIVQTGDGSPSFFVPALNEHYHSVHGARQESMHVFIDQGLMYFYQQHILAKGEAVPASEPKPGLPPCIHILEVGMGTGLNCLLSMQVAEKLGLCVMYYALEPDPLSFTERELLLASPAFSARERKQLELIYGVKPGASHLIGKEFRLRILEEGVQQAHLPLCFFDLVYFDAFGPQAQPEMWTEAVFRRMFDSLKAGGMLTTYSARGSVKRALKARGFHLDHPQGPPGKREITRASKPQHDKVLLHSEVDKMQKAELVIRVYGLALHLGRLLLCDEYWFDTPMTKLPGGGLEYGEGTHDCLMRECREEFGQEVRVGDHFFTTDVFQPALFRANKQLVSIYYYIEIPDPQAIPAGEKAFDFVLKEGAMGFRWVDLQQLMPEDISLPLDRKVVEMLKKQVSKEVGGEGFEPPKA